MVIRQARKRAAGHWTSVARRVAGWRTRPGFPGTERRANPGVQPFIRDNLLLHSVLWKPKASELLRWQKVDQKHRQRQALTSRRSLRSRRHGVTASEAPAALLRRLLGPLASLAVQMYSTAPPSLVLHSTQSSDNLESSRYQSSAASTVPSTFVSSRPPSRVRFGYGMSMPSASNRSFTPVTYSPRVFT